MTSKHLKMAVCLMDMFDAERHTQI